MKQKARKHAGTIRPNMAVKSQIWPDIVVPFANNYSVALMATDVARRTGIPRRTVTRMLAALSTTRLIRYRIEGKNKRYYLDLRDYRTKLLVYFIEHYKAVQFSLKHPSMLAMLEDIGKLRDFVVFGSYAKGTAAAGSDLDVFVIGRSSDKILDIVRRQVMDIHVQFSTLSEFERLTKKKNTLALEIMHNHIVFGSSQFVEMCWRYYHHEN